MTIGVTPTRSIEIVRSTDVKRALDRLAGEGMDFAVVESSSRAACQR
jgi:hypothetical protein